MGKNKKKFGEWVTLTHDHRQEDNKQLSPRVMMIKEQGQLLDIERVDKKEK
jgi:hypothetical protein